MVAIAGAVTLIFGSLFPNVMPTTLADGMSLVVHGDGGIVAASSSYTLGVMTVVAVILTPIVLAYQAWTYWVFKRRLSEEHMPEHNELTFKTPAGLK